MVSGGAWTVERGAAGNFKQEAELEMNYIEKALELMKEEKDRTGRRIHHIHVKHDSWCSIYDGGCCDCDPDVEIVKNSPACQRSITDLPIRYF